MKKSNLMRTIFLAVSLLLQLSTLCFHSRGAAGDLDLSFDPGSGVNGTVRSIAVQPDGKVIIGGEFTLVKGLSRTGVARLNADGSGDPSFNANTNAYSFGNVRAIALQADGKVLINHDSGIVRLNTNGGVDASFGAEIYYSTHCECFPIVTAIAVQADGKVIVGGDFFTENGTNVNFGLARLNPNGTLDPEFNANTLGEVSTLALQPDGKVVAAGYQFARYDTDGSRDLTFSSAPEISSYGTVLLLAVQPDAKLLVGGYFATIHGTNRNGVARLNADGSLDNTFNASTATNSYISSVALQSDGKVFIGGYFSFGNGDRSFQVARLNINGTPDGSFVPGVANDSVNSLAAQSNGKVVAAGSFSTVNGTNRNSIARLNVDGSLDGSFYPGGGLASSVSSLELQPDGKVLIGGLFTFINGTNRYAQARLNADGSLDVTFISSANFHPDLTVLIGNMDCEQQPLCSDCWLDAFIAAVAVQPDGKVLVGGKVTTYTDCYSRAVTRLVLGRYNADGSSGGALMIGAPDSGIVTALALQPDGKILVNGWTRLNTNGTPDSTFNQGTGPNGGVNSVLVQADGKVLIGGSFTGVSGTNRSGIARLNADRSLDSSFNPGTGANGIVNSVAVQPDGKVLIGGEFTTVNGTNRNRIARLNVNGSLDLSFNPGTGADGIVRSIELQSDGNVLICGDFLTINGVLRPHVARLYGGATLIAPSLYIARSNAFVIVSWPASATGYSLQESTNLSLSNAWSLVGQPMTTNAGLVSVQVPIAQGQRFFRLSSQ